MTPARWNSTLQKWEPINCGADRKPLIYAPHERGMTMKLCTLPGALGWADLERQKRRARIWDAIVSALALACLFLPMFIDIFGA